ncbi:hypothetical protein BRADI_5g09345v3 [Brachypodium distachyon]|uniref:Uncharacterized protein n=1 Tax=Brachypodium distachyon TaxID=15368 RepID=A0A0Q3I8S6_BRADI|nr:hypothetical protein BRADI_5g09345v3 [Brachypodium distachyon]
MVCFSPSELINETVKEFYTGMHQQPVTGRRSCRRRAEFRTGIPAEPKFHLPAPNPTNRRLDGHPSPGRESMVKDFTRDPNFTIAPIQSPPLPKTDWSLIPLCQTPDHIIELK